MKEAARDLNFELAAQIRDKIQEITFTIQKK
jgi:excinuclease UvrABC helicase subunit UvrB